MLGLAVSIVALGFVACIAPPVTHALSSIFALDDLSPFDRAQLVKVADATRDYSFGSHDDLALYKVIYEVDSAYRQSILAAGGSVPSDFPRIDDIASMENPAQYERVFANASELYCYSPETMSHLDDCHAIMQTAIPFLVAMALLAFVGMIVCGSLGKKHTVAVVLLVAAAIVLVLFVALGVWAAVDFNGLFTVFHNLFFSQGNWTFPYDSLLICALPTQFWMGMAGVWLAVSIVAAITSLLIGLKLR